MTTASGPSRPWTRLRARWARSRSAPASPQRPGCSPRWTSTPSGTGAAAPGPAVGRAGAPRRAPVSQPSSCQRTRSAMAAAVSVPSCRHTRCSSWPSAVTASMPSRVQARPCAASRSCSRSASTRPANAATSTRSSGSSYVSLTSRSGGGLRTASGRWSKPGGQPMRQRTVEPEPGEHIGGGQRREIPERLDPQPAQQVGQFGPLQRLDGHAGEELPGLPRRDDPPGPGRQPGGEDPVGDPDLALHRAGLGDLLDDPFGGRLPRRRSTGPAPGRPARRPPAGSPRPRRRPPRRRRPPARRPARPAPDHAPRRPAAGHRLCASRRRSPRRTPSARADSEQASTRLPCSTTTGPEAGTPSTISAAITGQSGHQSSRVRTPPPPPTHAATSPQRRLPTAPPRPRSPEVSKSVPRAPERPFQGPRATRRGGAARTRHQVRGVAADDGAGAVAA